MATWQLLLLVWAAGIPAAVLMVSALCQRLTCRHRARRARAAAPALRSTLLLLSGPQPRATAGRFRK